MSSVGGEAAELGGANRERLRAALGLQALVRGYQVHGADTEIVREVPPGEPPPEQLPRADGQATALRGVGVMVLAADCVPVAIGAPGAVAIVHAGWRGLAGGVIERGAQAVRDLADADGSLEAVIGPGAGGCCYEVGPEVLDALAIPPAADPAAGARSPVPAGISAPPPRRDGHALLDLRALARERLLAAGVELVSQLGGCTICDERFFSHRREGERSGRILGVAWRS
ncbi:MAG TPA: polyphenol oxidase family protein [Solirubrobacteraceae bacterium]|jgi:hypothetical protein